MKKIYKSLLCILAISVFITSCSLDTDNYQDIPTENAYNSLQDVQNGMNGAYWALGTYRFYGKNVVAIGDMGADIALGSTSSGHYANFSRYVLNENTAELAQVWEYGYKVIDGCVRTINGANKVLTENKNLTDEDIAKINLYTSQCYSLKALASFTLVNIFGLPYNQGIDNLGIPLLTDKPLNAFENIERATVGATYTLILSDIANAKEYMEKALENGDVKNPSAFYLNEAAIYALEARVLLHMNDLPDAKIAAQRALSKIGGKDVSNEGYVTMWSSIAISDEDIFTICKTADDNLSANALNTLYGSYKGALVTNFVANFFDSDKDIRLNLINGSHPEKFDGIPTAQAVSNIPVFRKSEMYLIIAEAEAEAENITLAQEALFYTAKRNIEITDPTDLPATKEDLLTFIERERVREFFQEGHRFYEARRTESKITVAGNKPNFDISKFVYPVPSTEINAGFGVVQNPNWADALPD